MKMNIIKKWMKYLRTNNSMDLNIEEAMQMLKLNKNIYLIDVRSPQEYAEDHLENATSLPLYDLKNKIKELVPDYETIIIVYCRSGIRSKKALKILKKMNYKNIYQIKGGVDS